jgi:glycosyltransferase involved in cell wall biosynthesis
VTDRPHVVLLSGTALSAKNGSSKVERRLAEALSARFHVTLLTRDTTPLAATPFVHAVYSRPSSKPWRLALLGARAGATILGRLHAARPIALVHAFETFPAAHYATRLAVPLVLTHHNMVVVPESAWAARAARRAAASAAAGIALNALQAEALRALGVRQVTVIANGVGGEAERAPDVPLPQGAALFAGRLSTDKGVHLLLDAYAAVPAERRRPLVIVGDGRDAEAVRARARVLGAEVRPWLAHDELLGTLAQAALLVSPSFAEASPLLPLEAMARGVPVAIHDLPALAGELYAPGGAARAHVVPVGDQAAWSRLLEQSTVVADPALCARARAAAEARAWPRVAEAYALVYARVLGLPP